MGMWFSLQTLNVLAYLYYHYLNLNFNTKKLLITVPIKTDNACTIHLTPPTNKKSKNSRDHMVGWV